VLGAFRTGFFAGRRDIERGIHGGHAFDRFTYFIGNVSRLNDVKVALFAETYQEQPSSLKSSVERQKNRLSSGSLNRSGQNRAGNKSVQSPVHQAADVAWWAFVFKQSGDEEIGDEVVEALAISIDAHGVKLSYALLHAAKNSIENSVHKAGGFRFAKTLRQLHGFIQDNCGRCLRTLQEFVRCKS
jgi:hypothetical protein